MPPLFWDGVAFALRWTLAVAHLVFVACVFPRPDLPELLPITFRPFAEVMDWYLWGTWNLVAALLLIFVPTRVPLGLISTAFSAYCSFVVAAVYASGAGLVPSTLFYFSLGSVGVMLFGRSLWAYMTQVRWFRRRVMSRSRSGHGSARQ